MSGRNATRKRPGQRDEREMITRPFSFSFFLPSSSLVIIFFFFLSLCLAASSSFLSFLSVGRPKFQRVMAGAVEGDVFVGNKAVSAHSALSVLSLSPSAPPNGRALPLSLPLSLSLPAARSPIPPVPCVLGFLSFLLFFQEQLRGLLKLGYPISHGMVEDWLDIELVWAYVFSEMKVNSEEVSLLHRQILPLLLFLTGAPSFSSTSFFSSRKSSKNPSFSSQDGPYCTPGVVT